MSVLPILAQVDLASFDLAQVDAKPSADQAAGVMDIILSGGVFGFMILIVLFALSVATAYLLFDQVMSLRRREVIPDGTAEAVRQALLTGRIPEADAACRRSPSVLSVVLLSGLSELDMGWGPCGKSSGRLLGNSGCSLDAENRIFIRDREYRTDGRIARNRHRNDLRVPASCIDSGGSWRGGSRRRHLSSISNDRGGAAGINPCACDLCGLPQPGRRLDC